jgi:hypothetical protein
MRIAECGLRNNERIQLRMPISGVISDRFQNFGFRTASLARGPITASHSAIRVPQSAFHSSLWRERALPFHHIALLG